MKRYPLLLWAAEFPVQKILIFESGSYILCIKCGRILKIRACAILGMLWRGLHMFEFEFELTREDILAFSRYGGWYTPSKRKRWRSFRSYFLVMLGLSVISICFRILNPPIRPIAFVFVTWLKQLGKNGGSRHV